MTPIEELEAAAAKAKSRAYPMTHRERMDAEYAEAQALLAQAYAYLAKNEALLQARGL